MKMNLAFADFEIGTMVPYLLAHAISRANLPTIDETCAVAEKSTMPFPFSRFIATRAILILKVHWIGCNFNLKDHLRLNIMYV
jgi:hypothetical protein